MVIGWLSNIVPGKSTTAHSAMHCPGFFMFALVCVDMSFVVIICPVAVDMAVAQCRDGDRIAVDSPIAVLPLFKVILVSLVASSQGCSLDAPAAVNTCPCCCSLLKLAAASCASGVWAAAVMVNSFPCRVPPTACPNWATL